MAAAKRLTVLSILVVLAGCSGGSGGDAAETTVVVDTTVEPTTTVTTEATTTTTEATTTTSEVFALPADPAGAVDAVRLSVSDFGPGYSLSDSDEDDGILCEGVSDLEAELPPIESVEETYLGDHLFFANVGAYASPDDAVSAFEYLSGAYQECNGGIRVVDGQEILLGAFSFSPPSILGTDRLIGLALDQTTPDESVLVQTRLIASGPLLIFVGGTDPDVVQEMAATIVGRTRAPAEPVTFSPAGVAVIGPGYTNPAYYSFAEGPDELRALALGEEALDWLNSNSLERVDEVASTSCVTTQTLTPGDSGEFIDQTLLLGVFSDEDRAGYSPEVLGEVYGAANGIYCPGLRDYLLEVLNAIPE